MSFRYERTAYQHRSGSQGTKPGGAEADLRRLGARPGLDSVMLVVVSIGGDEERHTTHTAQILPRFMTMPPS